MAASNEIVLFDFENQVESAVKAVCEGNEIPLKIRLADDTGELEEEFVVIIFDLGQAEGHQGQSNNGTSHFDCYDGVLTIGFTTPAHGHRESKVLEMRQWRHEIRARIRHLFNRARGADLINPNLAYHEIVYIAPMPMSVEIMEARNLNRDGIQYAVRVAIKPESWPVG